VVLETYRVPASGLIYLTGWAIPAAYNLGLTDYLGVSGQFGSASGPPGAFTNRSQVALAQISSADGTSNTLLFGESLGDSEVGPRFTANSWIGAGALPTALGTPVGGPLPYGNFSSRHPGVVLFCFANGSVHPVRKGITNNPEYTTSINLSSWCDGQPVDAPSIQ
jgi:hypothetical protein